MWAAVGTQAWIAVLESDDGFAPLVLQAKQAQRSVLAGYTAESRYGNHGERVVAGQLLISSRWTVARGYARAGDRGAIAAYLGTSDKFDRARTPVEIAPKAFDPVSSGESRCALTVRFPGG